MHTTAFLHNDFVEVVMQPWQMRAATELSVPRDLAEHTGRS